MQLEATSPSSHTVQALHAPRSQPILVPVKPSWSRMTCTSVVAGSTRTVASRSLIDKDKRTGPGPNTGLPVTDEVVSVAIEDLRDYHRSESPRAAFKTSQSDWKHLRTRRNRSSPL